MTWLTVLTERKPIPIKSEFARIVRGAYGKQYDTDEDGNEVQLYEKEKRGRGRPKKTDGVNFSYTPEMMYCEMLWSGIDIDMITKIHAKKGKK
jgi:hypothetical protein